MVVVEDVELISQKVYVLIAQSFLRWFHSICLPVVILVVVVIVNMFYIFLYPFIFFIFCQ